MVQAGSAAARPKAQHKMTAAKMKEANAASAALDIFGGAFDF